MACILHLFTFPIMGLLIVNGSFVIWSSFINFNWINYSYYVARCLYNALSDPICRVLSKYAVHKFMVNMWMLTNPYLFIAQSMNQKCYPTHLQYRFLCMLDQVYLWLCFGHDSQSSNICGSTWWMDVRKLPTRMKTQLQHKARQMIW